MRWTRSTLSRSSPPTLWDYLERAAYFMVNVEDDPANGG